MVASLKILIIILSLGVCISTDRSMPYQIDDYSGKCHYNYNLTSICLLVIVIIYAIFGG